MTPQDLAEKISAHPQTNGAAPDARPAPSLPLNNLVSRLSAQIQAATGTPQADTTQKITAILAEKTGSPQTDLTNLLNQLQPSDPNNSALAQMLVQMQAQQQSLDLTILQQIQNQLGQFLQANPAPAAADIAQLRSNIVQSLQSQGVDQAAIQHYLTELAKTLKQENTPASDNAQPVSPLAAVTAALMTQPHQVSLPRTEAPQQTVASTPSIPAPIDLKGTHGLKAAAPKEAAPPPPPSLPPTNASLPAPAPQQQAPQQNLSGKIAGFSVSPGMVNALANSDGSFSSDGSGMGDNSQSSGLAANAGILQPVGVDALNNQSFTNYLTAAKDALSPTTQMINMQLQRNIAAKIDTMSIQLQPADLGRMDIKLKFAKDGSVKAHMTVDKPETLALLQKDSHHLERILQKTGTNADKNSLSFDLRQQNQQQNLGGFQGSNKRNGDEFSSAMDGLPIENALQAKIAIQANGYITQSGVNIMV